MIIFMMKEVYVAPMTVVLDLKCRGFLCVSVGGSRVDYGDPIPISFGPSSIESPFDSPLDFPLF
jgi:hypothetical protein